MQFLSAANSYDFIWTFITCSKNPRLRIRGLDSYLRFLIFVFLFNTGKERKSEKFFKSILLIQKTNETLVGKEKEFKKLNENWKLVKNTINI